MPRQRLLFSIGAGWLLALTACVPTITEEWVVQPVDGLVFDAESMRPLAGARVSSPTDPALTIETDRAGRFQVPGQSRTSFQVLMPASSLATQLWVVSHPDFVDAVAISLTLAPARHEQENSLSIPLFTKVEGSPPDCRFGGYLLSLGEWLKASGGDVDYTFDELVQHVPCADSDMRSRLMNLAMELHGL